jgi:hypothetical protein
LSSKEQNIQDLERALSEWSETSGTDVDEMRECLKLLFEEYREALKLFGTRLGPLPDSEKISDLLYWMLKEF